jgi:hypothetical protein
MTKLNFAESFKVMPILGSKDIVATATVTNYVDLNFAEGLVELEFNFGLITSTDSTGEVVVTIEASNVSDTTSSDLVEAAIAFQYRLSGAVGTDTMGAIASATTAGVAIVNTVDNATLLAYVDPSAVAQVSGARYIRGVVTPTAEVVSTNVGAVARFIPRYAGNSQPSSS